MRTFVVVWAGQTFSLLGTRITGFALTLWVFERTGQATSIAFMWLFFGVAGAAANLLAGPLVDRFNRKTLIWLADSLAGAVTFTYLILFATGNLQIWHIFLGSVARGVVDTIQQLAFSSSIALMVPKEQFVRTSVMGRFTHYAGNIVGPGLGAILYTSIGLIGVMLVDILTFVAAIIFVLAISIPQPERRPVERIEDQTYPTLMQKMSASLRQTLKDFSFGFKHIFARRGLRAMFIASTVFVFFDGPPNALLAPLILARTNNDANAYAAVGVASGIGGVAMSILVSIWGGPKKTRIHAHLLGMLAAGLAKIGISLSPSNAGRALSQGAASANFPLLGGTGQAIWMQKTDPALQGRIFAARVIAAQIAFNLGFGLAAPLGDYVFEPAFASTGLLASTLGRLVGTTPGSGYAFLFLLSAIGMASVGLIGYAVPNLRRVEAIEPDFTLPESKSELVEEN